MMLFYLNPRTIFTDSDKVAKSRVERSHIFFPKRVLSAAHNWSHTAMEFFPADGSGTAMGGRGFADVESGATTTVPLALFRALAVRITAVRHFCISLPCDGSKLTHQTSPRSIVDSAIRFINPANTVRDKSFTPFKHFSVKRLVLFDCKSGEIKRVFFHRKGFFQQSGYKIAPLPGRNGLLEPLRKHVRNMKKHLHKQSPFSISISISKKRVNITPPDNQGNRMNKRNHLKLQIVSKQYLKNLS
jgi:hypothetical protein